MCREKNCEFASSCWAHYQLIYLAMYIQLWPTAISHLENRAEQSLSRHSKTSFHETFPKSYTWSSLSDDCCRFHAERFRRRIADPYILQAWALRLVSGHDTIRLSKKRTLSKFELMYPNVASLPSCFSLQEAECSLYQDC